MTKVSIIIPCYNNGHLLSKMIDCVLRQTFPNWELIIIDDCSTDNTQGIVKEYADKDTRINLIVRNRPLKGPQTCRNIGLESAQGEFVVIFDADDLVSDTCLEKRVAFMDDNPAIDYASFPAKKFTDENKLPVYTDNDKTLIGAGNIKNVDLLSNLLTVHYPFTVWNNIYRRKSIESIRYIEVFGGYEDFDFMVSCVLKGLKHKFSGLKEIDYYWRIGQSSNMSSNLASKQYCDATINIFSQKFDILKQRPDYEKRKKEFRSFVIWHFERIVENGNHKNMPDYIGFCEKYYNKSFVGTLKIISKILCIQGTVLRQIVLYSLTTVLFCNRTSAFMLKNILKHWK